MKEISPFVKCVFTDVKYGNIKLVFTMKTFFLICVKIDHSAVTPGKKKLKKASVFQ